MDTDSDCINIGFERMEIALNSKLINENTSSKQLILILKHLLALKDGVEFNLQIKSKVGILVFKMINTEKFKYVLKLIAKQEKSEVYKILTECKESLLLPFNETNLKTTFNDNYNSEISNMTETISVFENKSVKTAPKTVIAWCADLFFENFNNISDHASQINFFARINAILRKNEVDKNIPIVIGVFSIIFMFGYKNESKIFSLYQHFSESSNLEQKILLFIETILLGARENHDNELAVLFGILKIHESPKKVFEIYILIKEQVLPTKVLYQIKEYLLFWKDDEIKRVLEYLQQNKTLEQFFLPISKHHHYSQMLNLYSESNDIVFPKTSFEFETNHTQKICREDVYSVDLFNSNLREVTNKCGRGEHYFFLKQLLSLNYLCRNSEFIKKKKCKEETCKTDLEVNSNNNNHEDDDDGFPNTMSNTFATRNIDKKISNADLVQEVVLICDSFLLQDVFEKMTLCQLAVPIVCPRSKTNVFHLWATRTIKKKWISYLPNNEIQNHEKFITKQKMATISFCRIGSTSVSKSKVANLFLSSAQGWQEHSYFINREIDSESILNQGCIEACWYCPDGRQQELLKNIYCVYNLRGNALENKEQLLFLMNVSSIVVIFVEKSLERNEREVLKLMEGLIVVVVLSDTNYSINKIGNRIVLGALHMNLKELSEKLVEVVSSFKQKVMSFEDHASHASLLGMEIDENNEACQLGKKAAEDFVNKLQSYDKKTLKTTVLPLQGKEFWIEWAKKDKEEMRQQYVGQKNPMEYSDNLRTEKGKVRESQFLNGASSEIIFFIERLLLFKNTIIQQYFISWCQMNLNEKSETHLPLMLKDYNNSNKKLSELLNQIESAKKSNNEDNIYLTYLQSLIDQEKSIIKRFSEEFSIVSFGCEHIFREFSQIYESHTFRGQSNCISFLPKLVADIIVMGYPFEILDGDASHIPVTWVKQVLVEIKAKLGKDINVFVLSILGIQSSGKSTLLNIMFGSKFAVSSGRCTKGVYIQLIPVSSNLREVLNCDYFIVMDSEGLRSPELTELYKHDNEIATLIACLSNVTIINFMGQTFSKDMSDILEITLHAYIRMKKVQIKSSCHMIFACVSDVTAKDKNTFGVGKVFGELNTLIEKIAIEEGRNDIRRGLSSVFPLIQEQFDKMDLPHKLVFPEHLPSLWKGNMNPPESRYGEILLQLRNSICNGLMKNYNVGLNFQPLSEFLARLKNLWSAIKQENFIFGFKNSQAVQLFKEMQKVYENELSVVRKKFFEASYHLAEELLHQLNTLKEMEELKKFLKKFNEIIIPDVNSWKDSVNKNLKIYALGMSDAEMALSYLPSFAYDMDKKVISWIDQEQLITTGKIQMNCRKEKTAFMKRVEFKKKCLVKAREVAGGLNINASNNYLDATVINTNFEIIFQTWIEEAVLEDQKSIKSSDTLFIDFSNNLIGTFYEHVSSLNINYANLNNDIKIILNSTEKKNEEDFFFNITQLELTDIVKKSWGFKNEKKKIEALKNATFNCDAIIKNTKNILNIYKKKSSSYVAVVSQILESAKEDLSGKVNASYEFDNNFKIRFLIKVFVASVKEIAYFEAEQLVKNSLFTYLKAKREDLFVEFRDECLTVNSDACKGIRIINDILCPVVVEEIKLKVGLIVMNEMASKKEFSSKDTMIYYIQKEFLNAPFDQIMNYVKDYKSYISSWIEKKVLSYCLQNEFLRGCITDKIKSTILCFSNVLRSFTFDEQQMDINSWWKKTDEKLKSLNYKYKYSLDDVVNVLQNINDFRYLSLQIADEILKYEMQIFDLIILAATEQEKVTFSESDVIAKVLEWFVCNPINDLKEKRMGCTAQCPMCGAFCGGSISCLINDFTITKHRTEIHMPQGMVGCNNITTKRLVTGICSALICSNLELKINEETVKQKYRITHNQFIPYKEYQEILYDWHIQALPQASSTSFWQFLFVKHQSDLAKYYSVKEADDIPIGWRTVTVNEALNNLKDMYAVLEDSDSDFI